MAMLQLSGTLSNATVRISPRFNFWASTQQLLFVSSIAPDPNPLLETRKPHKIIESEPVHRGVNDKPRILSNVFKNLMKESTQVLKKDSEMIDSTKQMNEKLEAAKNTEEVLQITEDSQFTEKIAPNVISKLYKLVAEGASKLYEFESDRRYLKICRILSPRKQKTFKSHYANIYDANNDLSMFNILNAEKALQQLSKLKTPDLLKVLSSLTNKKNRVTPILQVIANKLSLSNEHFTIKELADILYSLAILNFPDTGLLQKICKDLQNVIPDNKSSSVIGSILTSIGILHFRNEKILNTLTDWILQCKEGLRPQDITALLMTLATVGYTPKNFSQLYKEIIHPLKESDMTTTDEWLQLVWSLTILNQATPEHYESVLNKSFHSRLFDVSTLNTSKEQKILNINAAAELSLPVYKGPLLSKDSSIFRTTLLRSKEKHKLVSSIIGALRVLLPSDDLYLKENLNTGMGFLLDAEFFVDSDCNPISLSTEISQTNKNVHRIGVITCDYHDYCRGSNQLIGLVNFSIRILEQKGYKVLQIPYTDVSIDDKLITKVKYINEKLKSIVMKDQLLSIKV